MKNQTSNQTNHQASNQTRKQIEAHILEESIQDATQINRRLKFLTHYNHVQLETQIKQSKANSANEVINTYYEILQQKNPYLKIADSLLDKSLKKTFPTYSNPKRQFMKLALAHIATTILEDKGILPT